MVVGEIKKKMCSAVQIGIRINECDKEERRSVRKEEVGSKAEKEEEDLCTLDCWTLRRSREMKKGEVYRTDLNFDLR
jgi:hypothetical protein